MVETVVSYTPFLQINPFIPENSGISHPFTPASGLQMSINLGISGMICMHASRLKGITKLALKSNLLGKTGEQPWKKHRGVGQGVQPCPQVDALIQQTSQVVDPFVRLVQYPSRNGGFTTGITQSHPPRIAQPAKNHRIRGLNLE